MLTVQPVPTIEPTSYTPGSSSQPPNIALGTGTITAGPDRVWDLVRPVTLDGAQAYRDPASGQLALQTQIGTILVQTTDSTVPLGVPLSIRLTPGDPPLVTFLPSQGNAGQSGAARPGLVEADETPAVVLSDAVAVTDSLAPGQVIVLTAVAAQSESIASALGATALAPQSATGAAAELPVPIQAAAPLITQLVGAPSKPAAPVSISATVAQSAVPPESPPPGIPGAVVSTTIPPADLSLAQATLQAEAVAVSILSMSETTPSATSPAASSLSAAVGVIASSTVPADRVVPSDSADDLAGLPPALAAQLPPEDSRSTTPPPQASSAAVAVEDDADVSMRILAVVPPGAPMPPVPFGANVATVEGSTLAGQPILQADGRSLVAQAPAAVLPGTRIILDPINMAGASRPAAAPPALDPIAGRSWPALAAAIPALAESHFAAAEMMRLAIPQAGPLLGPVLLLFAAALRRGDARGWLGDAPLNQLQRAGHETLASALSTDFERASRQSAQALDDGWHTMPIPIFAEGAFSRVQFHLRRYKSSDGQGRSDGDRDDVRFVIEAEPSATGPVQLDGLVRHPPDSAVALDLIVRSQMPLPPGMRNDIAGLFSNSLAVTGLKGAIVFQGGMNWVKVARDRASAASVMA